MLVPRLLPPLKWLFVGLLSVAITARAYEPAPPVPPKVQAWAARLVAAPDDATRDRLLADAPMGPLEYPGFGRALNAAWEQIIYTGDYARAEQIGGYARALLLRRGDAVDAAFALFWLGFIDSCRGDNQAALAKMTEAQSVIKIADDQDKLARVLAGEGKVYLQLGDFQQALAVTRHALEIYRAIGGKDGIINTLNNSGSIFMAQGLADRALEYRQQALAVAGNDDAWLVYLLHNIANFYAWRGDRDKAIEYMSKSLVSAEKVGDRPNYAAGLQELGGFHLKNGQLVLAEAELRRSLRISEEVGDKSRQAGTLNRLGELLRQRGDEPSRQEAVAIAKRAVNLARETGEPANIWQSCTLAGRLHLAAHEPDSAREDFEESIAAIEDARGHLAANDVGATAFLEDKVDAYYGMVTLLVQAARPTEALAMAERAKARVLVDLLSGPKFDLTRAMSEEERTAARQSSDRIAALNRQIASVQATGATANLTLRAELNARLATARQTREDAEQDFFIAHPELRRRRLSPGGSLSPADLAGLLADGKTTVLEYAVSEDATFLFTVSKAPGGGMDTAPLVQVKCLPLGRTSLYARTERFRTSVAERSLRWETDARALGKDLLGPVCTLCEHSERLVIVPDGPLWDLPFQALVVDKDEKTNRPAGTLWQRCALSLAPSLTFLAQTPDVPPLTRRPRLLAIGNPSLGNARTGGVHREAESALDADEIEPLPDAERQVKTLADLYGSSQSVALVGKDAHEDTFKRLASDYDVFHFATHGFLNDTAPMYSRLLMSQTDLAPDEDGYLEAWEWLPLRLHARLAVLAACESGRGKLGIGEGLLGLSWALFQAGCPAAVVSQWNVDSASTTELMIAFHRYLLAGDSPAVALRRSGLELAKNPKYQHPFYWTPFVVIGSDKAIVIKRPY